ncbi:diaminopimelate epimerase [Legionella dresdenensis]|uniref:Diaminopimelate epimerase n=1 Tax=Legionella dresdenensis TaxID=450200 RepID=A0ABV8CEP5_9GAMM
MNLRFTKMHGLGNDFIVIDAINQSVNLLPHEIAMLAQRNTGIGFDQCLMVESSNDPAVDFFYRIFNANGQEVGQCGNGARCLARFIQHQQLTDKDSITVATRTTVMKLTINGDDSVTVSFGLPKFHPVDIPMLAFQQAASYQLSLQDGTLHSIHAVNVGNPHAVSVVHDVAEAPVAALGQEISEHCNFPEQTNAGFMQIIDQNHIALRVYERGCGETQACGSGAVAAAIVGKLHYQLDSRIHVMLPGGELIIEWPDESSPVLLTGPASFVYDGVLYSGMLSCE